MPMVKITQAEPYLGTILTSELGPEAPLFSSYPNLPPLSRHLILPCSKQKTQKDLRDSSALPAPTCQTLLQTHASLISSKAKKRVGRLRLEPMDLTSHAHVSDLLLYQATFLRIFILF